MANQRLLTKGEVMDCWMARSPDNPYDTALCKAQDAKTLKEVFVILDEAGYGDKSKGLVASEFDKKYVVEFDPDKTLVEILREALKLGKMPEQK